MPHAATLASLLLLPALTFAADIEPLLKQIKAVGREGAGNAEARAAWKELVQIGPSALLPTLAAMRDASPASANWLRTVVDAVAERELRAGRALAAEPLEMFVKDTQQDPAARRLAYEWLAKVDR